MRTFRSSIGLLALMAAVSIACAEKSTPVRAVPSHKPLAPPVITNYRSLIVALRAAGFKVEPRGEAEQPFLSIKGKMIKVGGEDVQVFQFPHAAQAEAQAALIAPSGDAIGTSKAHWIGVPHFYKNGKLLVLYVGENDTALKALEAVLGEQIAGK